MSELRLTPRQSFLIRSFEDYCGIFMNFFKKEFSLKCAWDKHIVLYYKIQRLCSSIHILTSLCQTNYQPIFNNEQSYNHKIGRDLEKAYGSPSHPNLGCIEIILESDSLPFSFTFKSEGSTVSELQLTTIVTGLMVHLLLPFFSSLFHSSLLQ